MVQLLVFSLVVSGVLSAGKILDLHSFTKETALNVYNSRWSNFGTSVPLKSHIILTPSVPDRWGAQFHKYPLLTDRFEVRFSLNLKKAAMTSGTPPSQSFAFWYVKENVTAAVPEVLAFAAEDITTILSQSGFHFSGYRGRFEGVGVVFSYLPRPSISIVFNDGSRDFRSSDMPLKDSAVFDFRKPRVEIRVAFETGKVAVSVREGSQGRWSELVQGVSPQGVFSGGFIGLSGVVDRDERHADVVTIDDFTVENLDLKQKGEEAIVVSEGGLDDEEGDFLNDYGEVAEGKALKILTRNIYRLISETEEPRKATSSAVRVMNTRLDAVDRAIEELRGELNNQAGGDMEISFKKMKEELTQISQGSSTKKKIAESLISASGRGSPGKAGRGESVAKASRLKEKLTGSGSYLLGLLGIALFGVCAVGSMMWFKVGKWEKKHIL